MLYHLKHLVQGFLFGIMIVQIDDTVLLGFKAIRFLCLYFGNQICGLPSQMLGRSVALSIASLMNLIFSLLLLLDLCIQVIFTLHSLTLFNMSQLCLVVAVI